MKLNYIALLLSIVTLGLFSFATPVYADQCTTDYGGTTTCSASDLTINKQVKNPSSNVYVENLIVSDYLFAPGAEVKYQLTIKNSSGQTFDPVTVKDTLPPHLTFVAGPGTYDANSRTLTFTLNNMIAGETRTILITAKVVGLDQFPSGKSTICETNYADVRALNRFDSDTAQACYGSNVLGATTLPVAGYNDLLMVLPFATLALGGAVLLKKS